MKPQKNIILLFLLIVFTSACSLYRINSEEITTNFYPAKSSPEEVVYVEGVTEAHEVIGTVTVNTERSQSMDEVIAKIKKEAAILGGDAVTNLSSNATGTWKKIPPKKLLENAYIRQNITATVIVYK